MLMSINRCLDYTKSSNGVKLVPKMETIVLQDAIDLPVRCIVSMQSQVQVIVEPWSSDICNCVITDKQWIQENLLCLLSNAVKYSTGGTVTIYILLEDHHEPQDCTSCNESNRAKYLRIEVEDTGIGMSEEAMASLFNPFKQTQRLAGGTGLGLYSLSQRLEALHGFYGVMKRRDGKQGSLFWFSVPYKPDNAYANHLSSKARKDENHSRNFVNKSNDSVISAQTDSLRKAAMGLRAQGEHISPMSPRLSFLSGLRVNTNQVPLLKLNQMHGSTSARSTADGDMTECTARTDHTFMTATSPSSSVSSASSTATPRTPRPELGNNPCDEIDTDQKSARSCPSKMRILLVDDSPTIVKMISMMLKKLGHAVQVAQNGAIAVQVIRDSMAHISIETGGIDVVSVTKKFDIILMDLQMPVMDGLEATRRIRTWEKELIETNKVNNSFKHIIVGISANGDHETMALARVAGIDTFLPKPFDMQKVVEKLNEISEVASNE